MCDTECSDHTKTSDFVCSSGPVLQLNQQLASRTQLASQLLIVQ
ncbi:hypothetical protein [Bradyrhizobium sp. WSM471]